jgi:hypothetical protein
VGNEAHLLSLGALPGKLAWDREGTIAPRGRPTQDFLTFCEELSLGWVILDPVDAPAKGALERSHRFLHGNFEAGRRFANARDFQDQLDLGSAVHVYNGVRLGSASGPVPQGGSILDRRKRLTSQSALTVCAKRTSDALPGRTEPSDRTLCL